MITKQFEFTETEVTNPAPGIVYINSADQTIYFRCPCGCDDLIVLPYRKNYSDHPNWVIVGKNSITPSIQRNDHTCRSHFSIRLGTVIWH